MNCDYIKSGRYDNNKNPRTSYKLCPKCGDTMFQVGVHSTRGKQHIDISLKLKYCIRCRIISNMGETIQNP